MTLPDSSQTPLKFIRPKAFYDIWQEGEGIPIYKAFHVGSLMDVALGDWKRFGCRGAFVNLADSHITTAAILEIPPGRRTLPIKHVFEGIIYGVAGRGKTTVSAPECPEVSVEWGANSLFSPPLNTIYRHENLDRTKPLTLLMVSNAPLVLSLFHNERFVFDNAAVFDDRFRGQPDYFMDSGQHLGGRVWRTNFVPDVSKFSLIDWVRRGSAAKSFHFSMAQNTMACHLSEFAVGTYKKAHRHGPGAHVVILAGEGYSLLWEEGKERTRIDWQPGSMFSPPEWWYHQHFNTSAEPVRYLALRRGGSPEHPLRIGMSARKGGSEDSGAEQIEYEDEEPVIRQMYAREMAKKGIDLKMPPVEKAQRNKTRSNQQKR